MANTRQKRIVLVDDEGIAMENVSGLLSVNGFVVIRCYTADECLDVLSDRRKIDLFVVDVMLPVHTAYTRQETGQFRYTGLRLAHDIRRRRRMVPIVFLSNMTEPDGASVIRAQQENIGNSLFLQKFTQGSIDLAVRLALIAVSGTADIPSPTIMERVRNALIAQPNVSGIGIDLEKLIKGKRT